MTRSAILIVGLIVLGIPSIGIGNSNPLSFKSLLEPKEPEYVVYQVAEDDIVAAFKANKPILEQIFGLQAENVARFNRIHSSMVNMGDELKVPKIPAEKLYTPFPIFRISLARYNKIIIIDLSRQFLAAYERGFLRGSYPISSGTRPNEESPSGHATPKGKYRVIDKIKDAYSSKYEAPMPNGLKFTIWGHFIHAGQLPGYRASHGCIRLFRPDSAKLFD